MILIHSLILKQNIKRRHYSMHELECALTKQNHYFVTLFHFKIYDTF